MKTIEYQGRKQVEALKVSKLCTQQLSIKEKIPEGQLGEETKNKIENIKGKQGKQRKFGLSNLKQ